MTYLWIYLIGVAAHAVGSFVWAAINEARGLRTYHNDEIVEDLVWCAFWPVFYLVFLEVTALSLLRWLMHGKR